MQNKLSHDVYNRARAPMKVKAAFAGRLQAMLAKPSSDWTIDDIVRVYYKMGLKMVSLMHVGYDGWLKALDFMPHTEQHLRNILMAGERADGSSIFKGTGLSSARSDMVLRPRLESAFINPFSKVPGLCVLCSHLDRDCRPLPQSPQCIIEKAHLRCKEVGVELYALGEVEYFIGRKSNGESDGACFGIDKKEMGYHSTAPFMFGDTVRQKALAILNEMGFACKYGHGEVGYIPASIRGDVVWEQHEIELDLMPLERAANAVVIAQWVLRNLVAQEKMFISFEPIIKKGHAGNGLHFHVSPVVKGQHISLLAPTGHEMTRVAVWLIAGLVRLGGALMAFGNRVPGSITRLTQGMEAPNKVLWGWYNRKALIRLPTQARNAKGEALAPDTIEFRLGDGSAHPHLLLAAIAQSLRLGRELGSEAYTVVSQTQADGKQSNGSAAAPVPHNFEQVAAELEKHIPELAAGGVFSEGMLQGLVKMYKQKSGLQSKL